MRRSNFFTAALVALITYVALSAFVGRRSWSRYRGWGYNHCYYNDRYDDRGYRDHYDDRNGSPREKQSQTDSTFNK